jgi:hypothetical protein
VKKASALMAVTCVGLTNVPVHAQDEPPLGSRLGKRNQVAIPHSMQESVRAAHNLADCVYLKNGAAVRASLNLADGKEAKRRLSAIRTKGTCIGISTVADDSEVQRANIPTDIYRGMLAESALQQGKLAVSLMPLERKPTYVAEWFAATGRDIAIDEMGACVAETDPAGIRALIATTAQTTEEARAISALSPSMGPSYDRRKTQRQSTVFAGSVGRGAVSSCRNSNCRGATMIGMMR